MLSLQLAPDNWTSFVQRCDTIFSSASNCIVQGTAWSDCSRPDDATTHYVVGQLEGGTVNTVNSYSFDSGFIDNAGSGWQTREYVGGVRGCALCSCTGPSCISPAGICSAQTDS